MSSLPSAHAHTHEHEGRRLSHRRIDWGKWQTAKGKKEDSVRVVATNFIRMMPTFVYTTSLAGFLKCQQFLLKMLP